MHTKLEVLFVTRSQNFNAKAFAVFQMFVFCIDLCVPVDAQLAASFVVENTNLSACGDRVRQGQLALPATTPSKT